MIDGHITNVATNNKKWGKSDKDRFNLALMWAATRSDTVTMQAKLHRNKQGGTYSQGSDAFNYEVNEDKDLSITTKNYQLGLTYSKTMEDDFKNTLSFGFSTSDQNSESDADGTPQDIAGIRYEKHKDRYLSAENRVNYKAERFEYLLGVHVHQFTLTDDYRFNLLFPVSRTVTTPLAVNQDTVHKRSTVALFNSTTFHLTKNHSLLAGLRIETVNSLFGTDVGGQRQKDLGTAANTTIDNYVSQIAGEYSGRNSNTVLLPKFAYMFLVDEHHTSLSYTRGYRTAGLSINRRRATAVTYDPEFTSNYELSYKFSRSIFQIGANAFYIDWRHQQVQVQLTNDFYDTQVQNAARSELYGAELETSYQIDSVHKLSAGVGHVKTQFKKFETNGVNYAGKRFPFSSDFTASLAHNWKLMEDLNLLTTARYINESYSNA